MARVNNDGNLLTKQKFKGVLSGSSSFEENQYFSYLWVNLLERLTIFSEPF